MTNICLDCLPDDPVVLGQLSHPDRCPLGANLTGCHIPHTPFLSEYGPWCCTLVLQPPDLHIHPGLGQLRSVTCEARESIKSAFPHYHNISGKKPHNSDKPGRYVTILFCKDLYSMFYVIYLFVFS